MKLIIILIAVLTVFGAEPLEKIYTRYKTAEEIQVYKKADAAMVMPSQSEYDALSPEEKEKYKKYADYRKAKADEYNIVKVAIKDKLTALKAVIVASKEFDASEKTQYANEIDAENGKITPLATAVK